jgi:phosphate transport system substrate-binding protein
MSHESSREVSRRRFLVGAGATGAIGLAGCLQETDGGSTNNGGGQVIVKGSSTVFPVSDAFAEAFIDETGDINVTVDSTGTGGGFENHFCPGEADINGASRPITEAEQSSCQDNGVNPVEFQIGGDALTVAVNNSADWVDCVTLDELSQIWREDGAEMWSDVRPEEWPDQEFQLYGPASTSGTYDWLSNNVIGEEYRHTTDHQPTEEDEQIVQGIEDNEASMGYFGYAYYSENSDAVKALEIDGGDGCTPPSLENATDGSYPLARPLYIYVAESALERDPVYNFVEFYLERAGTENVKDIGYVPASDSLVEENLNKLEEVAGR